MHLIGDDSYRRNGITEICIRERTFDGNWHEASAGTNDLTQVLSGQNERSAQEGVVLPLILIR